MLYCFIGVDAVVTITVLYPVPFVEVALKATVAGQRLTNTEGQVQRRFIEPVSHIWEQAQAVCLSPTAGSAIPSLLPSRYGYIHLLLPNRRHGGTFVLVLEAETNPRLSFASRSAGTIEEISREASAETVR